MEAECLDVWMYTYIINISLVDIYRYTCTIHSFHALNQDFTVVQSASELQIDALDSKSIWIDLEPGKNRQDGFGKGFSHGFSRLDSTRAVLPCAGASGFRVPGFLCSCKHQWTKKCSTGGSCKWIMCLTTSKPSNELVELT